jgi:cell division inhibitor SepF
MGKHLDKFLSILNLDDDSFDEDDDFFDEDDDYEEPISKREEARLLKKEAKQREKEERRLAAYSDDSAQEPIPAPEKRRTSIRTSRNNVVPMRTTANGLEVCIFKPNKFEDAEDICDLLLKGHPVIINLEGLDISDTAQRIMDFISGCIFTLSGNLHQISRFIFICAPENVNISGDFLKMEENDEFNISFLNKEF